jgi:hypothetical protein
MFGVVHMHYIDMGNLAALLELWWGILCAFHSTKQGGGLSLHVIRPIITLLHKKEEKCRRHVASVTWVRDIYSMSEGSPHAGRLAGAS